MLTKACNSSRQKLRQEDHKLEGSLGYIVRLGIEQNQITKELGL